MSCRSDCRTPPEFPRAIFNRPGLTRIDHRIGTFDDIRSYVLARLDADPALAAWTHRLADDPAIALAEGASIVGDILTFYQSLYANEYYLRTADWRESVADLVRLLGYRLAPGLAGEAVFAVLAKGANAVAIPKGFGFKAQIVGQEKPVVFESGAAAVAYPSLSRFNLYRPRFRPAVINGDRVFEVSSQSAELSLKSGDRLLIGAPNPADGNPNQLAFFQTAILDRIEKSLDKTIVTLKAGLRLAATTVSLSASTAAGRSGTEIVVERRPIAKSGFVTAELKADVSRRFPTDSVPAAVQTPSSFAELTAFKVEGSYRHFGHDAPAQQVSVNSSGVAVSRPVSFVRALDSGVGLPASPPIPDTGLPLDSTTETITAGSTVLVEAAAISSPGDAQGIPSCVVHRVAGKATQTFNWGPRTGSSTLLTLDDDLAVRVGGQGYGYADIRTINVHQVAGGGFRLAAVLASTSEETGRELDFFGSGSEARALQGRALLLVAPRREAVQATVVAADAVTAPDERCLRRITLDRDVSYSDFDPESPVVSALGNLVHVTQGKSEDPVAVGDGDRRQAFQTFPLPKAPLAYLLRPEETPTYHAELRVWVDGVEWSRVDTLFGEAGDASVYVVREDPEGRSFIQFGDGKTGARLTSGTGNVRVFFRTGSGAAGALQSNTNPQFGSRLDGLDKALLPVRVVGGTPQETQESARNAGPGRMQSLGRLVGLSDYEAEAMALPSVVKARATWADVYGAPVLRLTVMTVNEEAAEAEQVARSVRELEFAKGARRAALEVRQGRRSPVRVALVVGYDSRRLEKDVRGNVLQALGVAGVEASGATGDAGLFDLGLRQFGQPAQGSQIVGAAQEVVGVVWVRLLEARLAEDNSPSPGPVANLYGAIPCSDTSVLSLDISDLALDLVAVSGASEEPQ